MDFGYAHHHGGIVTTSEGEHNLWWVGAIIYVVGSIMINFGSNVIKRDHMNVAKAAGSAPPLYKRFLWIFGFSVFGVGNILNFVAFGFAAQSLLAALGSIQFVSNLIFAYFICNEKITKASLIATAFIIAGNIVIVIFGSKSNNNNDLDELRALFLSPIFLAYLVFLAVTVAILQGLYLFFMFKIKKMAPNQPPLWMSRFQPIAYAAVSAMVGTNSIIIGKACSGLLHNAIGGDLSVFTSFWTYLLVVLFIGITAFWLYRLNTALKLYDAMFIIPVLQCIWLIFGVVGGGIYYQEFEEFSVLQGAFFIVGMGLLVFGILVLRPSSKAVAVDQIPDD